MVAVQPIVLMMQIDKLGFSALRPKRCLLAVNHKLRDIVASKLILDWSPEQISGWLKIHYPNNEACVCHETIYRSLFHSSARSAEKRAHGPSAVEAPHAPFATLERTRTVRGKIVDAISHPRTTAEAEDRAIPGHWEGDLLSGKEQLHCDAGGAAFTFSHADQSAEQRNESGGYCLGVSMFVNFRQPYAAR